MPGEDTEYQGSVCPGCGAPVEPDQVFCVNCGIRLVEDDAVTEMHLESDTPKPGNVCPHCGAPVNDDQDFCANVPKRCPGCGKILPPEMHFCTACGTRVD